MIILQDKEIEGNSSLWKNWMSQLLMTTCTPCAQKHGTIYPFNVDTTKYIPLHLNGQCKIVPMRTKPVGSATDAGTLGADINYYGGYRGHDRILFSNDGLIFVSYDHYKTYYEITRS